MDPDELKYSGVTGTELDIIDQTVCKQQADELLVDLDCLMGIRKVTEKSYNVRLVNIEERQGS